MRGGVLSRVAPKDIATLEQELGTGALFDAALGLADYVSGPFERKVVLDEATAIDAIRARADLQGLKSDQEFMGRLMNGERPAKDRWAHAHERAFPSED